MGFFGSRSPILRRSKGALAPNDLATAQIKLTQGGADGVLALLCEEVFGY